MGSVSAIEYVPADTANVTGVDVLRLPVEEPVMVPPVVLLAVIGKTVGSLPGTVTLLTVRVLALVLVIVQLTVAPAATTTFLQVLLVCVQPDGTDSVAEYVRRFLRHGEFDSKTKRMGRVIRVSPTRLNVWRIHEDQERHFSWQ